MWWVSAATLAVAIAVVVYVQWSGNDGRAAFNTNPSALLVGDCVDLDETMTSGNPPTLIAKFALRDCSEFPQWAVVSTQRRVAIADRQGFIKDRQWCLDGAHAAGVENPRLDNDPPTSSTGAEAVTLHLVTAARDDPDKSGLLWAVCLVPVT